MESYRRFGVSGFLYTYLFLAGAFFGGCDSDPGQTPVSSVPKSELLSTVAGNPLILNLIVYQNGAEVANVESGQSASSISASGNIEVEVEYSDAESVVEERFFLEGTLDPERMNPNRKYAPPEMFSGLLTQYPYIRFGVRTSFSDGSIQELFTPDWQKVDSYTFEQASGDFVLEREEGLFTGGMR